MSQSYRTAGLMDPDWIRLQAINDSRSGRYVTDDGDIYVIVFDRSNSVTIGHLTPEFVGRGDPRAVDDFERDCYALFFGDPRKVLQIRSRDSAPKPVSFGCPVCGEVELRLINGRQTVAIGGCNHYIMWVTREGYETPRHWLGPFRQLRRRSEIATYADGTEAVYVGAASVPARVELPGTDQTKGDA